jgi:hypothetical protein
MMATSHIGTLMGLGLLAGTLAVASGSGACLVTLTFFRFSRAGAGGTIRPDGPEMGTKSFYTRFEDIRADNPMGLRSRLPSAVRARRAGHALAMIECPRKNVRARLDCNQRGCQWG